jgi:hypothetical protein
VSIYSRYLRKSITARSCFLRTFGGAGIRALWMIVLASFLSACWSHIFIGGQATRSNVA